MKKKDKGIKGVKLSKNNKLVSALPSAFDCSGFFELEKPFLFLIDSKDKKIIMNFPHPSQKQLQDAVEGAKKSGFGKQQTNVVDESYRYAFEYLPHEFACSTIIMEKVYNDILGAIQNSLGLDVGIRAELIKMNIYPKGGLFKKHVDSPKGEAFGSLVVFLPSYFEGGKLIVENKQISHEHNFSKNKKQNKVSWVAFYNDCIHEISEVLQGCRITLSFNLFYESLIQSCIQPKEEYLNFFLNLQREHCYGYYCQHYYGVNSLKQSGQKMRKMRFLKGKDYEIFNAAKSIEPKRISLKVLYNQSVKKPHQFTQCNPLEDNSEQNEENEEIPVDKLSKKKLVSKAKGKYQQFDQEQQNQYEEHYVTLYGNPNKVKQAEVAWYSHEGYDQDGQKQKYLKKLQLKRWKDFNQIQWLNLQNNNSRYKYAISSYYGNDYSIGEHYCQLVILIYL